MRWPNFSTSQRLADFGALMPRARLHPAVLAWAEKRAAKEPWAVAFSGGADSLALLLLVWWHWPSRRRNLVALHFNHRLRGRASAGDETFCRRVCAGLGVKLKVGRWKKVRRGASEAEARAARFEFFESALSRGRTRALWLGHQQDDIAETLMMRMARGSGTAGLAAPRPIQTFSTSRTHLRPLLTLKKREVTAALKRAEIPWREDASNGSEDFFRNRVRRSVIPAWRRAAGERDALAGAALARELMEEDDSALEAWLDELKLFSGRRTDSLNLVPLAGKPRALVRRALRRWLSNQPHAGTLSRQGFETLLAALERGRPARQSLGLKGFAVITANRLEFCATAKKVKRLK